MTLASQHSQTAQIDAMHSDIHPSSQTDYVQVFLSAWYRPRMRELDMSAQFECYQNCYSLSQPTESVTQGQRDIRPTGTFTTAKHHCHVANTRPHCSVTTPQCVRTTCLSNGVKMECRQGSPLLSLQNSRTFTRPFYNNCVHSKRHSSRPLDYMQSFLHRNRILTLTVPLSSNSLWTEYWQCVADNANNWPWTL